MIAVFAGFENDFHRHALDNFDIIAGRVFRRQKAELRTRGGRNAVDMAFVLAAASVSIYFNLHTLADAHLFELGLFEIRRDPDIV